MNTSSVKQIVPSVAVALAALGLVSTLVVRTSDAAFRDEVTNAGNSFQSGEVVLETDAVGALFNVPAMEPGQSTVSCLIVSYDGNIPDPEPVSLRYRTNGVIEGNPALADHLLLSVEQGPPGSNCAFTSGTGQQLLRSGETLAQFAASRRDYTSGARGFDPSISAGDTARPYRFTVTLAPDAPNTLQALTVNNVEFTWEITS